MRREPPAIKRCRAGSTYFDGRRATTISTVLWDLAGAFALVVATFMAAAWLPELAAWL